MCFRTEWISGRLSGKFSPNIQARQFWMFVCSEKQPSPVLGFLHLAVNIGTTENPI